MPDDLIRKTILESEKTRLRVSETILSMVDAGEEVSFTSVARKAQVSRTYLYRHEDLRGLIDDCRVTGMSKAELRREVIRLRFRVRELERIIREPGNN